MLSLRGHSSKKEKKNMAQDNLKSLLKDGGAIVYPAEDTVEGSSIRIPSVDTSLGADFGEDITDENRLFAATREPVAGFLIYGIAADIVEKWFVINDVTTDTPDPEVDRTIQKQLRVLKWKSVLHNSEGTGFIDYLRLYGNVLLVGAYDDAQKLSELRNEKAKGAALKQLVTYPKTRYSVSVKEQDETSLRYGLPTVYQVNDGARTFQVHYTRCFEQRGSSVLDLVWDDITCGRNIRWGVGQWVYRVGGGFLVVTFPKEIAGVPTTKAKLDAYVASGEWSNISHRTHVSIIEGMKVEFVGAQGAALNPEPFFDTNIKQISIATGIPKSILEGAEAGALTGSEKNDQQYYKKISGFQSALEDVNRWVIDQVLTQINGVPSEEQDSKPVGSVLKRMLRKVAPSIAKDQAPKTLDYEIKWNNAFEQTRIDEARTENIREDTNIKRLAYMTIDEVRVLNKKNELPNSEGAKLKATAQQSQNPFSLDQLVGEQVPPLQTNSSFTAMLKDYARKVMKGELTREKALEEGAVIIENYSRFEEGQAQIWVRNRTGKEGNVTLSPEMRGELDSQKKRFLADYARVLDDAERLHKKVQK
jgi:hypothetical protein